MDSREEIGKLFVASFTELYSSNNPRPPGDLDGLISPIISTQENLELCHIPSEFEVWATVRQIGSRKATGPDGLSALFYKQFWLTVKTAAIEMVQNVFRTGFLLKEINHTNISLISKVDNPNLVNHYRPIALCNVSYKIVSKILAEHLKSVLPRLISPMQAAFVPGRTI